MTHTFDSGGFFTFLVGLAHGVALPLALPMAVPMAFYVSYSLTYKKRFIPDWSAHLSNIM